MANFAWHFGVICAAMGLALGPHEALAQTSAPAIDAPGEHAQTLAETHWAGQLVWSNEQTSDADDWTLYFRSDGVLVYTTGGSTYDNGAWRQRNMLVTFETDDSLSVQVGAVGGDVMEGIAYNQAGQRGTWMFRRQAAQAYACPHNLVALRGTTAPLVCICPQTISFTTVWGEPTSYTDDSDICTAAVHAGIVTAGAGGRITVTPREGQAAYQGSTANGVTTLPYGSWGGSYTITEAKPPKAR
jgi:hypothetical protein